MLGKITKGLNHPRRYFIVTTKWAVVLQHKAIPCHFCDIVAKWTRVRNILRHILFLLAFGIATHAILDVIVDDEVQFLFRKPVMLCKQGVDLVNDGL